ncbi:hypothetical protein ACS0M5_004653, partial [Escherichia coli]
RRSASHRKPVIRVNTMQYIDREKAQRLIDRVEALAKEENISLQKNSCMNPDCSSARKRHRTTATWRSQKKSLGPKCYF